MTPPKIITSTPKPPAEKPLISADRKQALICSEPSNSNQLFRASFLKYFGRLPAQPQQNSGLSIPFITLSAPASYHQGPGAEAQKHTDSKTFGRTIHFRGNINDKETSGNKMLRKSVSEMSSTPVGAVQKQRTDTPYINAIIDQKPDRICKSYSASPLSVGSPFKTTICEDSSPDDDKYSETIKRSRTSSLSFKRKYKPRDAFLEDSEIRMKKVARNSENDFNATAEPTSDLYESRVDKILKIINSDYRSHTIKVSKSNRLNADVQPSNYSYYSLLFMLISNVCGVVLSLTFRILLFLHINAYHFLARLWSHWQLSDITRTGNNCLLYVILMPVMAILLIGYICIFAMVTLNRWLLTAVPNRVAQFISFDIQIVC